MSEKFNENLDSKEVQFGEIFNSIFSKIENGGLKEDDITKLFTEAEEKIAESLSSLSGESLTVEITADDEQEMTEGDWNNPPFIIIYKGGKMVTTISYPYKVSKNNLID